MRDSNLITVFLRHACVHRFIEYIDLCGREFPSTDTLLEEKIKFSECAT